MKEVRYPMTVTSDDGLQQALWGCPGWALSKFRVVFEGNTYDYEAARSLLLQRTSAAKPEPVGEAAPG